MCGLFSTKIDIWWIFLKLCTIISNLKILVKKALNIPAVEKKWNGIGLYFLFRLYFWFTVKFKETFEQLWSGLKAGYRGSGICCGKQFSISELLRTLLVLYKPMMLLTIIQTSKHEQSTLQSTVHFIKHNSPTQIPLSLIKFCSIHWAFHLTV